MIGKFGRYLRWWVADNKSTTLVVTGPLFVIVGPIGMVWSVLNGDSKTFLGSVVILLIGLIAMFSDVLLHRAKGKPWHQSR